MPTAGSLPTTHVYASIGLDLESPLVADTSFRWGGEERFYQAVAREVNAEKCWEKWGHLTRNKKTAPFAVWCIFAPGSKGRAEFKFADKERKVKERIALAKTALAFDIDGGNVSAQSLELALLGLGWESAFYTTWKAREDALRWRVVIPLATPHTVEGWDDFYSQKLTEFQKALEVHHGSLVAMDLSAKVFVQAHILPHEIPSMFLAGMTTKKLSDCLSIMEGHKDSVPGFACAKVFGTRGVALTHSSTFILSDGARRTLSPALFAGKGQVQRGGKPSPKPTERFVDIVEYRGNGSGEKAADTAKGWRVLGVKNVPSLAHGLDGAQYFAECGIHAARGHRRDALVGACWHLHRVGWGHAEIM